MISVSPAEPAWRQAPGNHGCLAVPSPQTATLGHNRLPKTRLFPGKPQQMVPDCQKPSGSPAPAPAPLGAPGAAACLPPSCLAVGGKGDE